MHEEARSALDLEDRIDIPAQARVRWVERRRHTDHGLAAAVLGVPGARVEHTHATVSEAFQPTCNRSRSAAVRAMEGASRRLE